MAMVSHIFDIEAIQDEMAGRGVTVGDACSRRAATYWSAKGAIC